MKNNLHQRLRSTLKGAIREYRMVDNHLDLDGELRVYVSAIHDCEAGLLLLDEAMEDDRFTSRDIARDFAALIRNHRAFIVERGSSLRARVLDGLISDI